MDTNYYKQFEPFFGHWYIKREIGSGSFGKVFEIERQEMGVTYKAALKAVTIPASEEELNNSLRHESMSIEEASDYYKEIAEYFYKECMLMSTLKGNTNIVGYEDHQIYQHQDGIGWDIFIRMELLTPLSDYIRNHTVDEILVKKLAIDICEALVICESDNIIHRDIKPDNIFVNSKGAFKLGDFGVARTLESTTGASTRVGTFDYAAPEVFSGNNKYDKRVDIYSLGMVMYRLLNENRQPFMSLPPAKPSFNEKEQAKARRMNGEKLPAPVHSNELTEIILKACEFDANNRFSSAKDMKEALENPSRIKAEKPVIPNTQPEPSMAGSYQDMETVLENGTVKLMGEDSKRNASLENTINYAETKYDWRADDRDGAYKADAKEKNSWIRITLFALIPVVIIVMLIIGKIQSDKEPDAAKGLEIGSVVEFGNYNGNTQWIVLEVQEDKALLLSKNTVCKKRYNDENVDITWEKCTLRKWLNSDYLDEAFTGVEKAAILKTKVVNADNDEYATDGGNDTEDKVFLLSIDEVNKYSKDNTARIAQTAEGEPAWWWLRSPGYSSYGAAGVDGYGSVISSGGNAHMDGAAVRPAMWVDISALK